MSLLEELFIKNLGGGGKNGLLMGDLKFSPLLSWCLISNNNKEISNIPKKNRGLNLQLVEPKSWV